MESIELNDGGLCSFCAEENPDLMEDLGRNFHASLHEALDRGWRMTVGTRIIVRRWMG